MLAVAVRFRPESSINDEKHIDEEDENKLNYNDNDNLIEVFESPQNYIRINNEFNLYFDNVLGFGSFQDDVFIKSIRSKANAFLNGNNCCILTYGAKGSGKSYTMFGKLENKNAVSHLGILPRTISYIIEKLQSFYTNQSNHNPMDWNLFISFGNVYNDKIYDLIDTTNTKNIHLKKNKKTNEYYLKNLTQIKIKKISSFLKNMHIAYQNRKHYLSENNKKQKKSIPNNDVFSRCHMFALIKLNVYTINGIDKNGNKQKTKISSTILNFIDCASYPQINYKPNSERDKIDYQHLNFSFIQLNALMTRIAKKNDLTIDNRESVLTKLLYPIRQNHRSLAMMNNNNNNNGNNRHHFEPNNQYIDDFGKLLVMINCTLKSSLRAETMATLRFGNLPTVDPFILGMMEKQRHKIKKYEVKMRDLKIKIKTQKKELKQNANNNEKTKDDNKEIKQLKLRMDELNKMINRLRIENDELINKNSIDNNNSFEYQNKFDKLQSDYELLKLDYMSIKKELNTQKNHNFWLMEDYNDLKIKYDNIGGKNNGLHTNTSNNDHVGNLLKEIRKLREESRESSRLLNAADNKLKEYELTINEYENEIQHISETHRVELNELMVGIKERDDQINELRKELKIKEESNVREHKIMKNDREIYENYIKDLELLLATNNIKYDNTKSRDLESSSSSDTKIRDIYSDNNDNKDPEFIIRKLRMEIIKYKTDINSSSIVSKLRDNKHKLEEKVINLRTGKAKQLVTFSQEKHKLEDIINKLQIKINNINAIRKWMKLVHKRQLIGISKDMERAQRKMKENYSQNSSFRDQMYLLRKIAEQKFEHALQHKMNKKINMIEPAMTLEPYKSITTNQSMINYEFEQIAIDATGDFEQEMVGLLPSNLKRIHEVIDQLTNKLMIKNGQLHEMRIKYDKLNRKYKQIEYNLNLQRSNYLNNGNNSNSSLKNTIPSTPNNDESLDDDTFDATLDAVDDDYKDDDNNNDITIPPPPSTRIHSKQLQQKQNNTKQTKHAVTNSSFDSYLPSILDKLNLQQNGNNNNNNNDILDEEETDNDNYEAIKAATKELNITISNISNMAKLPTNSTTLNMNASSTESYMMSYENVIYDDDDLIINNTHHNNQDMMESYDTKQEEHYLKSLNSPFTTKTMTKTITYSASDDTKTYYNLNNHHINNYLYDDELPSIPPSNNNNNSIKQSNPKQFTLRARSRSTTKKKTNNNNNNNLSSSNLIDINNDIDSEEYKQKQKQLRLLQQSLSIAFHIDNGKNTRIKLNVSMTPKDVYNEMCNGLINHSFKNKRFTLIVQHNISPDFERIIIPFENTNMSFWELIVEFGILNLLHFNICCDENVENYFNHKNNHNHNNDLNGYDPKIKYKKTRKKTKDDNKRGSGLWNMLTRK